MLCGHYKGVDERVRTGLIDREVSVGDYVLTGGEPAALGLIDAVMRLIPGVLGNFSSALDDSFQEAVLDCPWYTRPGTFEGASVPEILLSGDHANVARWRRRQAAGDGEPFYQHTLAAALRQARLRLIRARWAAAGGSIAARASSLGLQPNKQGRWFLACLGGLADSFLLA